MIDQLINIYYNDRDWDNDKLSVDKIINYYYILLRKDNLIIYIEDGIIIGFAEYWKINKDQLLRIKNEDRFDIGIENINDGDICYVHDFWVDKKYRNKKIALTISSSIRDRCSNCSTFVGNEVKHDNRWREIKWDQKNKKHNNKQQKQHLHQSHPQKKNDCVICKWDN